MGNIPKSAHVHPTADIAPTAVIGENTFIWNFAQVREGARVGDGSIIGMGAYVDKNVVVGANCKLQNYVCTYHGVTLEDGVFVGPCVSFTNDLQPRAVRPDGTRKEGDDWTLTHTLVRFGAALGANCTIVCGITIGRWAMVGAGSVVTRDVPDYALVVGNPARIRGFVSPKGVRMELVRRPKPGDEWVEMVCPLLGERVRIPADVYAKCVER